MDASQSIPPKCHVVGWHPSRECYASSSKNGEVTFMEFTKPKQWRIVKRLQVSHSITCLALQPHSLYGISVGTQSGLSVWDIRPNSKRQTRESFQCRWTSDLGQVQCLDWSPCGSMVAATMALRRECIVWDADSNQSETLSLNFTQSGGFGQVQWSRGAGHFIAVCDVSRPLIHVWRVSDWSCTSYNQLSGIPTNLAWHPEGMPQS